ncbi:hypothetical protein JCM11957_06730 [Caminibacter profundus]
MISIKNAQRNTFFKAINELKVDYLIKDMDKENGIMYVSSLSEEEIEEKIKELELEEVKKQIANIATNKVKEILKEYDYDSEGEVALYAANENSEWYEEAKAIQTWIEEVYKKMYELQDTVTIDNYETIDLEAIETELPEFTQ